ncbi:MAG: hypothetical protein JSV66_18870 [Trueperaceae bacterium]|nr:MAG: hypothetical protein JSV66_18870 [Trueperaceae bacterium]
MVLPLILIVAGALLLVFNQGWLDFTALLPLLRLWPLLLIAVGLDIFLRGRYRLAVVLGTVVVGALLLTVGVPGLKVQPAETHAIEVSLDGARQAEIDLGVSVSRLKIGALDSAETLLSGTVDTHRGEQLNRDFRTSGDTAIFSLRSERRGPARVTGPRGGDNIWDLRLSTSVPLELDIDSGVGRSDLDLSELQLKDLRMNTGVGESVVSLPGRGRFEASIETGVGATTIYLPSALAARIKIDSGIGAVSVLGDFERQGELYLTPDYDGAEHRVDLSVEGGVGAIRIERRG